MKSLLLPLAVLALLTGCQKAGEVNVEILAHESISNLRIGNRDIDLDSRATKYLGIDLPLGEHEVAWTSDGETYGARINVHSNSDNYLLLNEKQPLLEVDGGIDVIREAAPPHKD